MSRTEGNGESAGEIELASLTLDVNRELPTRQVSKSGKRHSLVDLHIFLPDLTFIPLMIDQHTQATEIMDMIITAQGLNPTEARRALSLWLVSADLELQLKPNHCPTQLFSKWPVYLRKYTTLSEKTLASQQPLVHLRRNVYMSREEDLKVTDSQILELLFTEARCNIMDGTYPCERDLIISLAGILCAIQYGPYKEQEHTPEFYKANPAALFPVSASNDCKILINGLIDSLASEKTTATQSTEELQASYIYACSDALAYYGSVFFDGYIKRVGRSFLHSTWLSVRIGANTDGIYIISSEKEEPLLGILYEDLTWEYVEVCTCTTADCSHAKSAVGRHQHRQVKASRDKVSTLSCLLLQYPASPDEQSEGVNFQVLKVYTKSARLIDAFIQNCSEIMRQKAKTSPINSPEVMIAAAGFPTKDAVDCVDAPPKFPLTATYSMVDAPRRRESLEKSIKSLKKPNKLICQSFNKNGQCVNAQ